MGHKILWDFDIKTKIPEAYGKESGETGDLRKN